MSKNAIKEWIEAFPIDKWIYRQISRLDRWNRLMNELVKLRVRDK